MRDNQISVKLPFVLLKKLEEEAKKKKRKRNDMLNIILEMYFEKIESEEKGDLLSVESSREIVPDTYTNATK